MPDRSVLVTLRANVAGYNRDILSSAATTGILADRIDAASESLGRFNKYTLREINFLSGRIRLAADAIATFGPALVPIAAVGVPAITGLASSVGFLATGLGAVMVSSYGVGDALKALNKYALEPTDENMEKVEDTLLKLAPAAQAFVLQLRDLGPTLAEIRDAGAEELFPRVGDALTELETLAPTFEELVSRVSRKIGELSKQGAEALTGDSWMEFFSFLEEEAPLAIGKSARALGNLAHAGAELWMAFDPLNDDFLDVLVRGTEEIDRWATGLEQTQGFQEFIDYLEANGPQVGETLGAIAMMLLDIVEAAAPIGAATLPILEAVADVISTIADSDLGTPILGVLALSRAFALLNRGMQASMFDDLRTIGRNDPWGAALTGGLKNATRETEKYNAAVGRLRGTMVRMAGAGGAVAGLLAVQSGLTDQIGLTNTALGASVGLMAGGWGAAIGAGIGLVMDFAASQERAVASAEDLAGAIDAQTGALTEQGYAAIGEALSDLADEAETAGISLSDVVSAAAEGGAAYDELARQLQAVIDAGTSIDEATGTTVMTDQALAASALAQALAGQNDEMKEAIGIAKGRKAGLDAAAESEENAAQAAESAAHPTRDVAEAIADMGDEALTAAEKADALAASLDALLGPGLDLSAATDAWRAGLRDLNSELSDNGRRLQGFTVDATENREVIRDRVKDLIAMLKAEAEAGATSGELTKKLRNNRKALLDAGEAAGLSRPKLAAYLNELGLTPKTVQTIIRLVGDLEAKGKATNTKAEYDKVPKSVNTTIKVENSQALAGARAVQSELSRIDPFVESVIRIRTEHIDVRLGGQGAGGSGGGHADRSQYSGRTLSTYSSSRAPMLARGSSSGLPTFEPTGGGGWTLPGGPPKYPTDPGQYGPGSDTNGSPVLAAIIKAMLTSGFGPGQIRAFQKDLNELQRALSKNKGKWTKDLREDARELLKEIRQAERDRARAIRDAFKGLETDLSQGAAAIRMEMRDLKRDLREAGGVWNKAMHKHAERIVELAVKYDAQAATLEAQRQTLGDLTAEGERLAGAWQSLSDQVQSNFSSDLFGNGLAGFFSTAAQDTQQASMFQSVLAQLAAMGLDGPAFEALAASGDLKTAIQLLNSGAIGAFEDAYVARSNALTSLGQYAGDTVFGQAIADNAAQISNQNDLIAATEQTMANLQAAVDRQEATLRTLAGLDNRVEQGAYRGTKEGIQNVASSAGRDSARTGGGGWTGGQPWRP